MTHRRDDHIRGHGASGTCVSGKIAYTERREAKAVAALKKTRGIHVRPYRCQHCSMWHVGHLPQAAMAGRMSADQVYGRARGAAS